MTSTATCSNTHQEKIVPADNPISESYSDGEKLISLQTFELYDKSNGKVIMTCDYDNGQDNGL